nr:MAG: internal scaffolding protein [Microviridae sp.]
MATTKQINTALTAVESNLKAAVIIYSQFNPPPFEALDGFEESKTQQHFADEVNINSIMERYAKTQVIDVPELQGVFGDFSGEVEFLTYQNALKEANDQFMMLDAKIRRRFENSPVELLKFLEVPENRAEAIELGLISAETKIIAPTPVETPKTAIKPEKTDSKMEAAK